jgi:hypothetical protein
MNNYLDVLTEALEASTKKELNVVAESADKLIPKFRNFRVKPKNYTVSLLPLVGKKFSDKEVSVLTDWLEMLGYYVTSKQSMLVGSVREIPFSKLKLKPNEMDDYGIVGVQADEYDKVKKEKESEKKQQEKDVNHQLKKVKSSEWVKTKFPSLNSSNQLKISNWIEGKDKELNIAFGNNFFNDLEDNLNIDRASLKSPKDLEIIKKLYKQSK